jgi:hypothetical protein
MEHFDGGVEGTNHPIGPPNFQDKNFWYQNLATLLPIPLRLLFYLVVSITKNKIKSILWWLTKTITDAHTLVSY